MHNNTAYLGNKPSHSALVNTILECREICLDRYPECKSVIFYRIFSQVRPLCYLFNESSVDKKVILYPEKPLVENDIINIVEIAADCHEFDAVPPLPNIFTSSSDKVSRSKRKANRYGYPIKRTGPWTPWTKCLNNKTKFLYSEVFFQCRFSEYQIRSQACEYGRIIQKRDCSTDAFSKTLSSAMSFIPHSTPYYPYPPQPYEHPNENSIEYTTRFAEHMQQLRRSHAECCRRQEWYREHSGRGNVTFCRHQCPLLEPLDANQVSKEWPRANQQYAFSEQNQYQEYREGQPELITIPAPNSSQVTSEDETESAQESNSGFGLHGSETVSRLTVDERLKTHEKEYFLGLQSRLSETVEEKNLLNAKAIEQHNFLHENNHQHQQPKDDYQYQQHQAGYSNANDQQQQRYEADHVQHGEHFNEPIKNVEDDFLEGENNQHQEQKSDADLGPGRPNYRYDNELQETISTSSNQKEIAQPKTHGLSNKSYAFTISNSFHEEKARHSQASRNKENLDHWLSSTLSPFEYSHQHITNSKQSLNKSAEIQPLVSSQELHQTREESNHQVMPQVPWKQQKLLQSFTDDKESVQFESNHNSQRPQSHSVQSSEYPHDEYYHRMQQQLTEPFINDGFYPEQKQHLSANLNTDYQDRQQQGDSHGQHSLQPLAENYYSQQYSFNGVEKKQHSSDYSTDDYPSQKQLQQQQLSQLSDKYYYQQPHQELSDNYYHRIHQEREQLQQSPELQADNRYHNQQPSGQSNNDNYGQQLQLLKPSTDDYQHQEQPQKPSQTSNNDYYHQQQQQRKFLESQDYYRQQTPQRTSEFSGHDYNHQQLNLQQPLEPAADNYHRQEQQELSELYNNQYYPQEQLQLWHPPKPSSDDYSRYQQPHQPIESSADHYYNEQQQQILEAITAEYHQERERQPHRPPEQPNDREQQRQPQQSLEPVTDDHYHREQQYIQQQPMRQSADTYYHQQQERMESSITDDYYHQRSQQPSEPSTDDHYGQQQSLESSSDDDHREQLPQKSSEPSADDHHRQELPQQPFEPST
ncbi:unnamed protein product, partial [Thelazia callipaeda]|uniref:Apple domain-containing protein n=1 Tax=Thelazia callipaeda TaxID=103827 RepID=A0A0N5DBV3_THECL